LPSVADLVAVVVSWLRSNSERALATRDLRAATSRAPGSGVELPPTYRSYTLRRKPHLPTRPAVELADLVAPTWSRSWPRSWPPRAREVLGFVGEELAGLSLRARNCSEQRGFSRWAGAVFHVNRPRRRPALSENETRWILFSVTPSRCSWCLSLTPAGGSPLQLPAYGACSCCRT